MGTRKKAFTIIEIIITLTISAAIFAGALPLIYKSITANRKAELRLKAYELAHQELENLRGTAVGSLTDYGFSVSQVPGATGYILVNKTIDGAVQTDIAKVTSQVNWNFQGQAEKVELTTYFYGNQ